MYCSQKLGEDFAKFCGLLRIYKLYEVNLTSQRSHLVVLLLSKFGSERGGFHILMQILDLSVIYVL